MLHLNAGCALAALAISAVLISTRAAAAESAGKIAPIAITTPWARATPGGARIGAAFVTLTGNGKAESLVAVRSPVAATVELHAHVHDAGVMRMRRVGAVAVPPDGSVVMRPGGYHIMLIDLAKPLREGDSFPVTLVFKTAGEVTMTVPVLKVGSPGPRGQATGVTPGHGGHKKH